MKSHQNLIKIVSILLITFFSPVIDENSSKASDLYKKNLGIATWVNDTTLSGWRNLGWTTNSKQNMKKYEIENDIKLFQVVSEPTRYGNTSFFIQAPPDGCFNRPSDCNRVNGESQKRVEAKTNYGFDGNIWVSISINIPTEYHFSDTYDGGHFNKAFVQFHSTESYFGPMFMLKISDENGFVWVHESAGGHLLIPGGNDDCASGAGTRHNDPKRMFCEARHDSYQLLPFSEIKRNSWYDFIFNINFDKDDISKAYHKIWLNGQLVHQRYNQTLWLDQNGIKENLANFNFGIYGSQKDRTYQSLYADEIHFGRTCQALLLENIGYQCDALSSQDIGKSNPFYIDFRDYYAKD
tara:strand:- start:234 stop:1289 length:1056 start_codon:yes stop_codon:yes gene_type:complete